MSPHKVHKGGEGAVPFTGFDYTDETGTVTSVTVTLTLDEGRGTESSTKPLPVAPPGGPSSRSVSFAQSDFKNAENVRALNMSTVPAVPNDATLPARTTDPQRLSSATGSTALNGPNGTAQSHVVTWVGDKQG